VDLDAGEATESTARGRGDAAWRPKLVALDIDGTLIEPGMRMLPAVVDAVGRAASCGAFVVLATGRSKQELRTVADTLGLTDGYAACSNGAVTVNLAGWRVIDEITFDAREAVRLVLAHVPRARVAVEHHDIGYLVTAPFPEGELHCAQHIRPLESILREPVTRVIVREPDGTPEELNAIVERIGLRGVSFAVGYQAWLDIGSIGVTKGYAVERIAARLGVDSRDCLAIGDGRNDIEMLRWAGRGVAMLNAPPEVQAAADAVTGSVADLGVVTELGRWYGPLAAAGCRVM
jgi:5-amino-6-(5-phospho-D-ribitylamino)uracil phosphatase